MKPRTGENQIDGSRAESAGEASARYALDVMDTDATAFGVKVMPTGERASSCTAAFPDRRSRPGARSDAIPK